MTIVVQPATNSDALALWERLHVWAENGYERGYCHCEDCDEIVSVLVVFFGLRRPSAPGIWNPVSEVQLQAKLNGWPS